MAGKSLLDVKYDELPDPTKVWLGSPKSREEGLGRLALLTNDQVRKAATEQIRTGRRVGMNWELTKMETPGLGRQPCEHSIVPLLSGLCFDDIYHFNPQQSSQWDGLRHFGMKVKTDANDEQHSEEKRLFYGGTTESEILEKGNDRIGIQHWAREGITGRGVLIDYASWADSKGLEYTTFSQHTIKLDDVLEIAQTSNIVFERGDILLIRSGFTREWEGMSSDAKKAYSTSQHPQHAGIEATTDVLRWLWDSGFSAVAGDAISFEVFPPTGDLMLHEHILAGWGMPIGEMFDLEELSRVCKEVGRWTFFLTSMPLNMPGGVSSPPNAQAIF
ncbi:hypothetical protein PFICI_05543 [Pestalotiopsis fici W106-1]|uniref:Cyclase n=1 Tax=Pestalotiopsis fici (strain W106-1 / CGMCC3.15140) TaxID=1229662 RepID=W3XE19_PESFW|nr:uncharacterized protein PFICI_05543 [Pestalotiopsis fici W106-1]ETS83667.1 hypothetical protein PFICI_05543 [Pestalotiopsis fici W106-1]